MKVERVMSHEAKEGRVEVDILVVVFLSLFFLGTESWEAVKISSPSGRSLERRKSTASALKFTIPTFNNVHLGNATDSSTGQC